jgi:uncharacterized protein YceK
MNVVLSKVGLCLAVLLLSGCASITQHISHQYVYSGAELDIKQMSGQTLPHEDITAAMFGWMPIVFGFFDLPLSLTVDTMLLPYDACMVTIGGKQRNGTNKPPTQSPPQSLPTQ